LGRRLTARCDLVGRHLARSGLRTHRLDNRELAELLRRCWSADLARVQRLRAELSAYTSLFVSGRQSGRAQLGKPVRSVDTNEESDTFRKSDDDSRLFALGRRSLSDLIGPDSFEIRADHIRLDGQYARVLAITAYPLLVTPGWLSVLVETDLPIEVSL